MLPWAILGAMMIIAALASFSEWLRDLLLWVPKKLWESTADMLATAVEAIPVPDFMATSGGLFSSISSDVWFFASVAQIHNGVPMIVGAYVARFALRRIPFIGG